MTQLEKSFGQLIRSDAGGKSGLQEEVGELGLRPRSENRPSGSGNVTFVHQKEVWPGGSIRNMNDSNSSVFGSCPPAIRVQRSRAKRQGGRMVF